MVHKRTGATFFVIVSILLCASAADEASGKGARIVVDDITSVTVEGDFLLKLSVKENGRAFFQDYSCDWRWEGENIRGVHLVAGTTIRNIVCDNPDLPDYSAGPHQARITLTDNSEQEKARYEFEYGEPQLTIKQASSDKCSSCGADGSCNLDNCLRLGKCVFKGGGLLGSDECKTCTEVGFSKCEDYSGAYIDQCEKSPCAGGKCKRIGNQCYIKQELTLQISGGLSKYAGAYNDVVFRREETAPLFEFDVGTCIPPVEAVITVRIYRTDKQINTLAANRLSENVYSASWSNWERDDAGELPVGEYVAQAIVEREGNVICSSDKKSFFLIFNSPAGLSRKEKEAFLFNDESGGLDEIAIVFECEEKGGLETELVDKCYARKYLLRPFSEGVFSRAVKVIDGEVSESSAAEKLMTYEAALFDYKVGMFELQKRDVTWLLKYVPGAQCLDDAALLTAFMRSSGIPAHTVTADANQRTAGWAFDTWVEAWLGDWLVFHPHQENGKGVGPVSRRHAGTMGLFGKEKNDLIIMADESTSLPAFLEDGQKEEQAETVIRILQTDEEGTEIPINDRSKARPRKEFDRIDPGIKELSMDYWGSPHEEAS